MDFPTFERRAHELYAEVPEHFLEGIDGLDVSRGTESHPTLPAVYTLGECVTEQYPSEFGGAGEVRSIVVLYYGSFLELSRIDDEWDWEEELYETLLHEVRHHLESLATEDELEEIDYAEDQNFSRREGARFDPYFYRSGKQRGEREWEVDGDFFIEVPLRRDDGGRALVVEWKGRSLALPRPEPLGDVHFLTIEAWSGPGEVVAVLLPRRGWRDWLRALLNPSQLVVLTGEVPDR